MKRISKAMQMDLDEEGVDIPFVEPHEHHANNKQRHSNRKEMNRLFKKEHFDKISRWN